MTQRYEPQQGDVLYRIGDPRAFGFAFSRGSDPGGVALPVAVVVGERSWVWGDPPVTHRGPCAGVLHAAPGNRGGYVVAGVLAREAEFCTGVWSTWRARFNLPVTDTGPTTVADLARVVGWGLA